MVRREQPLQPPLQRRGGWVRARDGASFGRVAHGEGERGRVGVVEAHEHCEFGVMAPPPNLVGDCGDLHPAGHNTHE